MSVRNTIRQHLLMGVLLQSVSALSISSAVAAIPPVCNSFTPIIDGIPDSSWDQTPFFGFTNRFDLPGGMITEMEPTFQVTWDNQNLYLFIEVLDPERVADSLVLDQDDAIEIFIDGGNEKENVYDSNDHHFLLRWSDNTVYYISENTTDPVGVTAVQTTLFTGYRLELAIAWTLIGAVPSEDFRLGFDMYVTDDVGGGNADQRVAWSDATGNNATTPATFGTLNMGEEFCETFCFVLMANGQPAMICL